MTMKDFLYNRLVFMGLLAASFYCFPDPSFEKFKEFLKTEDGQKAVFEAVASYARKEQARALEKQNQDRSRKMEEQFANPVKVPVDNSPVSGNPTARITIVEFSDFECPFCKRGAETVKQVLEKFGDEVRLVFKHRPLDFHKNAKKAHKAAWAAAQKGKFAQAKDFLFANQAALGDDSTYDRLADELKINRQEFRKLMDSPEADEAIRKDGQLADKLGVSGTPTYFINGVMLEGAYPYEEFERVIKRWQEKLKS